MLSMHVYKYSDCQRLALAPKLESILLSSTCICMSFDPFTCSVSCRTQSAGEWIVDSIDELMRIPRERSRKQRVLPGIPQLEAGLGQKLDKNP